MGEVEDTLPWVPEAFHVRFPVSVKSYSSAFGRRRVDGRLSSSSNARKNLWYLGYTHVDGANFLFRFITWMQALPIQLHENSPTLNKMSEVKLKRDKR